MNKDIRSFLIRLLIFTGILSATHFSIFHLFISDISLYIPLVAIYIFNTLLVLVIYWIVRYKVRRGSKKGYSIFLSLTILKMALAVVFLWPLFTGKSDYPRIEVINFFIPYFLYLAFEVLALNNLLKSQETK